MQTIPSLWKGLLMFWMTGKALREGEWEGERKANQCTQNGIWMAFSAHYSSNYIPPSDLLPGYFSLLFLHQNGAINWQVKLDWIKGRMKEVKRVVSSRLNVIGVETKKNSVWEKVKKKNQPLSYCTKVLSTFSCKYTICFAQVEAVIYIGLQRLPRPLMGLPPSVLLYVLTVSARLFTRFQHTASISMNVWMRRMCRNIRHNVNIPIVLCMLWTGGLMKICAIKSSNYS